MYEKDIIDQDFKILFKMFDTYKNDLKVMTETKIRIEKEKFKMGTELRNMICELDVKVQGLEKANEKANIKNNKLNKQVIQLKQMKDKLKQ